MAAASLFSISVSANPVGTIESPGQEIGFLGLVWFVVVVVNIPVNLFLYSLPLALLCRRYGKDVGDLPTNARAFTHTVVLVVLLISSFGALIDFLLVAGYSRANGYWLGATALIMLSAYVSSDRLLNLKPIPNLLQSGFLALMNPVFWAVLLFYEVEISSTNFLWIIIPLASLVLALIVLDKLRKWHNGTYQQESQWTDRMPALTRTVGKVYAVVVVALVVVSATLFVVSPGREVGGSAPHMLLYRSVPGPSYGVMYTFNTVSKPTSWSDISISLSSGPDSAVWHPVATSYSAGIPVTHSESDAGGTRLGSLLVWCNITDVTGSGGVNIGDMFTLTTGSTLRFDSSTNYTVGLIFDPTNEVFYRTTFTG